MLHYMDDILVCSISFVEMTAKSSRVLGALSECDLTLNIDECEFYNDTIIFLVHKLHTSGLSKEKVKTNAIVEFPKPENITEVRNFLGLSGHLSLSIHSSPNRYENYSAKISNSNGNSSRKTHSTNVNRSSPVRRFL